MRSFEGIIALLASLALARATTVHRLTIGTSFQQSIGHQEYQYYSIGSHHESHFAQHLRTMTTCTHNHHILHHHTSVTLGV